MRKLMSEIRLIARSSIWHFERRTSFWDYGGVQDGTRNRLPWSNSYPMIFAKAAGAPPQVRTLTHCWRSRDMVTTLRALNLIRKEYAAAFFLLADSLKDAVNVCLRNLKDFQLAIALARVYEGDHGATLLHIMETEILPKAVCDGDRWLASWAFWIIGERGKSVQALIVSQPGQRFHANATIAASGRINSPFTDKTSSYSDRRSGSGCLISTTEG